MYLPETNILVTRFMAEEGVSELTDYMPIDNDGAEPNEIVRKVAVIRGDVRFQMRCERILLRQLRPSARTVRTVRNFSSVFGRLPAHVATVDRPAGAAGR